MIGLFFTTVFPIIATLLAVCGAIVSIISMKYRKPYSSNSRQEKVSEILPLIVSCNRYLKLTERFDQLDADKERYGIIVEDHFKGYFKDA